MEENQFQTELEASTVQADEPTSVDNSEAELTEEVESTSEPLEENGQSFNVEEAEKNYTKADLINHTGTKNIAIACSNINATTHNKFTKNPTKSTK